MPRIANKLFSEKPDAVIDEIVAEYDGDLHGAVRALLLVNEQLELELNRTLGLSAGAKRTLH